jgi:hypothetical protein
MSTETQKRDELARKIYAALQARNAVADGGPPLILPWRADTSQDARHTRGLEECGCGISQDDPPPR